MNNQPQMRAVERSPHYPSVPDEVIGALDRYVNHKIAPGGFLTAVLCNDLREACGRADSINRHILFDIVGFIYNGIPASIWGSPEAVQQHLGAK